MKRAISGVSLLAVAICLLASPKRIAAEEGAAALQWLQPSDSRLQWINVADWESRSDGWQPVRVPKAWRDK